MCRNLSILATLILTGCATQPCPPPEVVEITRQSYIPVPSNLTAPCVVDCGEVVTNGDLLTCYQEQRLALAECDRRLDEIRNLP